MAGWLSSCAGEEGFAFGDAAAAAGALLLVPELPGAAVLSESDIGMCYRRRRRRRRHWRILSGWEVEDLVGLVLAGVRKSCMLGGADAVARRGGGGRRPT